MDSFTQVTGVLNLSLAVGGFEGASQGREKAVPMYSVPSVEKGAEEAPLCSELLGPGAFVAWFLQARGSGAWCSLDEGLLAEWAPVRPRR